MKPILIPVFLTAALAAYQSQQPSSEAPPNIEEYSPRSTLVVPQHIVKRAKYPFVDIHLHPQAQTREQADKLVEAMDSLNMRVMVNSFVRGGQGDALRKRIEVLKERAPDRFLVMGNIDYKGIDDPDFPARAAAQVEQNYKDGARGLKVWKDLGMMLKDGSGQLLPVDDPRLDPAFEVCARLKMPVLIHTADPKPLWDPMDKYNERWLELKQFGQRARPANGPSWETLIGQQHHLFEKHPRTIFIAAHFGWLGNDLGQAGAFLDAHPNVYLDCAAMVEDLARQPRFARQFFIRYQDRVLLGKDTWNPSEYGTYFRIFETDDEYFDHDRKRHGIWKAYGLDLPDDVLKKLYYKNALRIFPDLSPAGFPR